MRSIKTTLSFSFTVLMLTACASLTPDLLPDDYQAEVSVQVDLPEPPSRRLRPGDLILAATREDFPTVIVNDDNFLGGDAVGQIWSEEEAVIGVEIGGEARAYPIRLLSLVEVINDEIANRPVAVTWCPLCFTAIVFDRQVEARALTFGVSGYLYKNNLVMFDHQSETLWSQALGEGLKGAHRGERLEILPSRLTSWREWSELHPQSLILSPEGILAEGIELIDPYSGYYSSGAAGVAGRENEDDRLPIKSLVIGLAVGEVAKAYPLELIRESGLIADVVGGQPVLLVEERSTRTIGVFSRVSPAGTLTFKLDQGSGEMIDLETGSRWNVERAEAISGSLEGTRLARIEAPPIFWFAWADLFPGTLVYDQ